MPKSLSIEVNWAFVALTLVIVGIAFELFAPGIPRAFVQEVIIPVLGAIKGMVS